MNSIIISVKPRIRYEYEGIEYASTCKKLRILDDINEKEGEAMLQLSDIDHIDKSMKVERIIFKRLLSAE
jgi:hypothetical protein